MATTKSKAKPKAKSKGKKATGRPRSTWPGAVTQAAIVKLFGLKQQTIAEWECPRNEDGSYDVGAVVQWRFNRLKEQLEAARAAAGEGYQGNSPQLERKRAADAAMAEARYGEHVKTLVSRAEVDGKIARVLNDARVALEALGVSVAPQCEGRKHSEIRDILDREVRHITETMAREWEQDKALADGGLELEIHDRSGEDVE